jgi:N-acetylglucosamine kinase-like BadF-type ATPase
MPYAFGVDGGASNSRAVLATLQGEVLHTANGPGVNYHVCSSQSAVNTLHKLFQECLEGARAKESECKGLCFGLSGIGREHDHTVMTPILNQKFTTGTYILTSDAEIALSGGSLSDQGILVIAGTGSMVYGRSETGIVARAGGHGALLSDEGSGYRIGIEALRAVIRDEEELSIPTKLKKYIYEEMGFQGLEDTVQWANSGQAPKDKIASLAPLVIKAADEGDPAADEILHQQADQLALYVESVYNRLHTPDRVDIILTGGVLDQASNYWQIVRRKIMYLIPGAHVSAPKLEPVLGAVLYGLSHAKVEINSDLISTLRRTFADSKQHKPSTTIQKSEFEMDTSKEPKQPVSGTG